MCTDLIAEYTEVFEAYFFNTKTVEEHLRRNKRFGKWADTIDIFSYATALQYTVLTYSIKNKKWTKFEPRAKYSATIANTLCNHNCPQLYITNKNKKMPPPLQHWVDHELDAKRFYAKVMSNRFWSVA